MTRSTMLEVMREDYIRTARAKGLLDRIIINRHALKNALLPVVTLIGIEFAFLIGGLVVTEQVFNLNGIGRLFVQAVQNQDYTLTQALVMLVVADLRADQSRRRSAVCVARSAHPLRLKGEGAMSTSAPFQLAPHDIADEAFAIKRSALGALLEFCRRQPVGTFGMALVLVIAVAGSGRGMDRAVQPDRRTTSPR